jgi:hypothetical protein
MPHARPQEHRFPPGSTEERASVSLVDGCHGTEYSGRSGVSRSTTAGFRGGPLPTSIHKNSGDTLQGVASYCLAPPGMQDRCRITSVCPQHRSHRTGETWRCLSGFLFVCHAVYSHNHALYVPIYLPPTGFRSRGLSGARLGPGAGSSRGEPRYSNSQHKDQRCPITSALPNFTVL